MLVKIGLGLVAAGLVAVPLAATAAPAAPAPSGGRYLCVKPHTTYTFWDGKVTKQVWCKNPPPSVSGFKPLR